MGFLSDNTAPACPELLDAMVAANHGHARGYGDDDYSRRLDDAFGRFFGTEVRSFVVSTGTAANALALASVVPPYGAVYAHEQAHIVRDECGAPEFFGHGLRLVTLAGAGAKLDPATLAMALASHPPSVHTVQPRAVSITQATELGRVYRPAEVEALSEVCRNHNLVLHMDGARFANSLVALDVQPAAVTWQAGVDILSFGATKNGAIAAEAVVYFRPELVADLELRRKRAGHLLSKSRFAAAQLLAYLESGVWARNARHANAAARRVGDACGSALLEPVDANEVFARLGVPARTSLRAQGFEFYDWGSTLDGDARFVASWDQAESEVDALCNALKALRDPHGAR